MKSLFFTISLEIFLVLKALNQKKGSGKIYFVLSLSFFTMFFVLGSQVFGQNQKDLQKIEAFQKKVSQVIQKATRAYLALEGGSAIILSPQGEVFTNYHVVKSRKVGEKWYITDPQGKVHLIELLSYDRWGDLAYLKLHTVGAHPFLPLAKPFQLQPGDVLIALGNPFSFSKEGKPFASLGVASAVYTREYNYPLAIQTDAALNPGNSGGPLINLKGELVGITGKIAPRFGMGIGTGAGYAIPAEVIQNFWQAMKKKRGEVFHGTIQGLVLYENHTKPIIAKVEKDSRAYIAGLRPGDLLLSLNQIRLRNRYFFWNLVLSYPEGANIKLLVKRKNRKIPITLRLERFSPNFNGPIYVKNKPRLGIGVALKEKKLIIQKIVPSSLAHRYGLEVGDWILSVDGKKFSDPDSLAQYVRSRKKEVTLRFLLRRKNRVFSLEIPLK